MRYSTGIIAAGLLLGLAGGCEHSREYEGRRSAGAVTWGDDSYDNVPDTLDYLGSVQCGALATVRGKLTPPPESRDFYREWGMFRAWAEVRAQEGGVDRKAAFGAIDALTADLLAQLGEGTGEQKLARLKAANEGPMNACDSAIRNLPVRIWIGG